MHVMQLFIRFLCLELVLKIKEARKLNWAARAVQETLAGSCSSVEIRLQADIDGAYRPKTIYKKRRMIFKGTA